MVVGLVVEGGVVPAEGVVSLFGGVVLLLPSAVSFLPSVLTVVLSEAIVPVAWFRTLGLFPCFHFSFLLLPQK